MLWTGFVRDFRGRPLAGATVRAAEKGSETQRSLVATTDVSGYFELGPVRRVVKAKVEYLDWVALTRPRPTRSASGEFKDAIFLMAPRTKLELHASYADGSPVNGMPFVVHVNPYATTVADAWINEESVVRGIYSGLPVSLDVPQGVPLTISVPGGELDRLVNGQGETFENAPDGPPILAGEDGTASVEAIIRTDVRIEVAVLGPDGEPHPKASITYRGRRSQTERLGGAMKVPSDPHNERVRRLMSVRAEEPLDLRASFRDEDDAAKSMMAEAGLVLRGRSVQEFTLKLRPSHIRGVVTGPDGPIHRALIEFQPSMEPRGEVKRAYSGKDGSFIVQGLAPVSYSIAAESRLHSRKEFGMATPGDQPLSLFLADPLLAQVEFKLSLEGQELTRSDVWWVAADEDDMNTPVAASTLTPGAFAVSMGESPYVADQDGRLRTTSTYRTKRGSSIDFAIAPGIYRFYVQGSSWEERNGSSQSTTTEAMVTDWVKVLPGAQSVDLGLRDVAMARWEGQIAPARPDRGLNLTAFHRIGVAICTEDGEPLRVDSEGQSATRFVYSGWEGRIAVDKISPGPHEVWIGTEAQIESGRPIARHLVEFAPGTNALFLTY